MPCCPIVQAQYARVPFGALPACIEFNEYMQG